MSDRPDDASPWDVRQVLQATALFRGLTDAQIDWLTAIARKREVGPGEYLLREGEPDLSVHVIVEGRARLVKETSLGSRPSGIGELRAGDTFGELKIVDPRPSTASVVAATPVIAVSINLSAFDTHLALLDARSIVWRNVGQILADRLQRTSVTGADAIHRELAESEARAYAARFILFMFAMFGVFELAASAFSVLPVHHRPPDTVLSFILITWTLIPVVLSLRRSPFPLASYGLTWHGGGRVALQALAYTVPVLLVFLLLKIGIMLTVPSMAGRPLFDPAALFAGGPPDWGFYGVAVLLYAIHTPVQEFVARVGLQGSLQLFLRVPPGRVDWRAIVISNLVFASAHTYLGFWFAVAAFVSGLFWGWLFAKQGSLIGTIVSHLVVGYWAIFLLGVHAIIGGG